VWVASGEKKHIQDSVGNPEGKGRSRRRCDDNIKVGFKEIVQLYFCLKVKGKVLPRRGHEGPEGE
jgi:hypothetical protein